MLNKNNKDEIVIEKTTNLKKFIKSKFVEIDNMLIKKYEIIEIKNNCITKLKLHLI